MKRDIKFRAWTGEKMTDQITVAGNGHVTTWEVLETRPWPRLQSVDWIVMQFTGLKDTNGTEIYEGDIVQADRHSLFEVYWDKKGFGGISNEGDKYGPYTLNLYLNDKHPVLKVVGNIYEHPHLLTPTP